MSAESGESRELSWWGFTAIQTTQTRAYRLPHISLVSPLGNSYLPESRVRDRDLREEIDLQSASPSGTVTHERHTSHGHGKWHAPTTRIETREVRIQAVKALNQGQETRSRTSVKPLYRLNFDQNTKLKRPRISPLFSGLVN